MRAYVFFWTCPACGEYVSTKLPPRDEDAVLVCSACGKEFGETGTVPPETIAEEPGLA